MPVSADIQPQPTHTRTYDVGELFAAGRVAVLIVLAAGATLGFFF
jgi:hypothetical protein